MPSGRPRIAVCLAAYNGARWIGEQLDSILAQEDVDVTVYVSVDRSSDGTEAWVDRRAAEDPRVVALPHGQRFGNAAANFFRLLREVDLTGFDYLSLSDQDDIWLPGKLRRAHELISSSGVDAYSSNVVAFWPSGRSRLIRKSQPQRSWDFLFEGGGPGCTYVLRGDLARQLQEMLRSRRAEADAVRFHDLLIYAFGRVHGSGWVIDETPWVSYRQHGQNELGVNRGWGAFRSRARIVLSGAWSQPALIARLVGLENDPFVRECLSGDALGLIRLATRAGKCRRRGTDRILFALACVSLALSPRTR